MITGSTEDPHPHLAPDNPALEFRYPFPPENRPSDAGKRGSVPESGLDQWPSFLTRLDLGREACARPAPQRGLSIKIRERAFELTTLAWRKPAWTRPRSGPWTRAFNALTASPAAPRRGSEGAPELYSSFLVLLLPCLQNQTPKLRAAVPGFAERLYHRDQYRLGGGHCTGRSSRAQRPASDPEDRARQSHVERYPDRDRHGRTQRGRRAYVRRRVGAWDSRAQGRGSGDIRARTGHYC